MDDDAYGEPTKDDEGGVTAQEPEQQAYAQQPQQAYAQQPQQAYAQQPQQVYTAPASQPTVITTGGGDQPSVLIAYLLWFFLGIIGIHHLYIGRGVGIWLLALITAQGLGLWWLADLFLIPGSCAKVRGQQTIIVT